MRLPNWLRYFNKNILNRLTGIVARSAHGPFVIVQHTGRKSGRCYETPIIAIPTTGGFVVALTYGPDVDWYKNISASGRGGVLRHRREHAICGVEPLETRSGLAYFPPFESAILRRIGIRDFIKLNSC